PVAMNGHPGSTAIATLGAELRRALALAPQTGDANRAVMLIDGLGLKPADLAELSTRLGVKLEPSENLASMGIAAMPAGNKPIGQFAPALSLALAAARPQTLAVDFAHSRL